MVTENKSLTATGAFATLGGDHGNTGGKTFTSIASGNAQPYKASTQSNVKKHYNTKYPNLMQLVNKVKDDSMGGDVIVNGGALGEVQKIINTENLQEDENGDLIIPFAKNLRLKDRNNVIYLGEKDKTNNVQEIEQ